MQLCGGLESGTDLRMLRADRGRPMGEHCRKEGGSAGLLAGMQGGWVRGAQWREASRTAARQQWAILRHAGTARDSWRRRPCAAPSWSQCCQRPLCSGLPYLLHAGTRGAGEVWRNRATSRHIFPVNAQQRLTSALICQPGHRQCSPQVVEGMHVEGGLCTVHSCTSASPWDCKVPKAPTRKGQPNGGRHS